VFYISSTTNSDGIGGGDVWGGVIKTQFNFWSGLITSFASHFSHTFKAPPLEGLFFNHVS
jgi:hypothetical protein